MRYFIIIFVFLFGWGFSLLTAQELDIRVSVQAAPGLSGDQSVLKQLEQDLTQYINNRRWTEDAFKAEERIHGTLTFIITNRPALDEFTGTLQVQSFRPVYNSSYESLLLTFNDQDLAFKYLPQQALEYSENAYTSNLTSLVNFYMLMILGFDYDSYAPSGGSPFFIRAQNIQNAAAGAQQKGWNFSDGTRTRYWLLENMINNTLKDIRKVNYDFHRKGLDQMSEKLEDGRKAVLESLIVLQKFYKQNPQAYIIRIFCDTKKIEIADIFKSASDDQKRQMLNIMSEVDPSNLGIYNRVFNK